MKIIKYSLLTLAIVAAALAAAYIALQQGWTGDLNLKYRASDDARQALINDERVRVIQTEWISMQPVDRIPDTALVLYPGAGCDPVAYAPVMRAIADAGYLAVIVPMPSYWAILAPDRLLAVKQQFPQIRHWAIAGHSMGGGAAAMLIDQHPDAVDAVIMWDSYTNDRLSLTDMRLPATSIYATGHHNPDRPEIFEQAKPYMPASTRYIAIPGGDHFQFGSFNKADIAEFNTATISTTDQQRQLISATVATLAQLSP